MSAAAWRTAVTLILRRYRPTIADISERWVAVGRENVYASDELYTLSNSNTMILPLNNHSCLDQSNIIHDENTSSMSLSVSVSNKSSHTKIIQTTSRAGWDTNQIQMMWHFVFKFIFNFFIFYSKTEFLRKLILIQIYLKVLLCSHCKKEQHHLVQLTWVE